MRVVLIHLSDIHFKNKRDFLTSRVESIKRAVQGISHSFDACILAVSGDIAFSGQEDEYHIAYDFFQELYGSLQNMRPELLMAEIYIPGNHDVFLPTEQVHARQHDVQGVLRAASEGAPDTFMLNRLLSCHDNFFGFLTARGCEIPNEQRLRYTVDIPLNEVLIRFHCYNTATLSQRNEKQGELIAPIWLSDVLEGQSDDPDIVVSMLHHPYGWLESNNARAFRRRVEMSSDIVLSGHEHIAEQYSKQVSGGDQTLFFEGAVLQERGDFATNSGFHVILLDTIQRAYMSWEFKWDHDHYKTQTHSENWNPISREGKLISSVFEPEDTFLNEYLNDPGAGYTHPAKKLSLNDIYVYPDLEEILLGKKNAVGAVTLRGAQTFKYLLEHKKMLIIGGERSGKTSLAKRLWTSFFDNNFLPLSLSGSEFKSVDEGNIRKVITQHVLKQYGKQVVERYWQEDKEKRTLIIDDLHRCPLNREGLGLLLKTCSDLYGYMVVFAGNPFAVNDISEGGNDPAAPQILSFRLFNLKEFGHKLRRELIQKWYRIGREFDNATETQNDVRESERLINTLLGKSLLPSYPFFVLTLLQLRESRTTYNNNLGAYGYHYEALITDALDKALKERNSQISVDTIYTYLSRVAFRMFSASNRYLAAEEIQEVIDQYRVEIGLRLPPELQEVLESSRLISVDADQQFRFTYGYIYCYFVARYLRDSLNRSVSEGEMRRHIENLIADLHIEDFANILIFLIYLTKDERTILAILAHGKLLFSLHRPCNFDTDVEFLRQLNGREPARMIIDVSDIRNNNDSHLDRLDHAERVNAATLSEKDELRLDNQIDEALLVNHALKTLHVLGQILRNFPGSLPRELKKEIATECYTLGLRTLSAIFALIEPNIDDMRLFFSKILTDVRRIENREELAQQTDLLLYEMCLCGSYWLIKHISNAVGLEQLVETYREVKLPEAPLAQALIDLSIKLDHFRSFPENDIEKLNDKLTRRSGTLRVNEMDNKGQSGKIVSFKPMQSAFTVKNFFAHHLFRQLICNHFYLFPIDYTKRDRICSLLGIQVNEIKMLGSWDKRIEPVKQIAG